MGHPSFEMVRHDVIDPFKFEVDQIYNLACPASPVHYQYNAIKTIKTSVMGRSIAFGQASDPARVFQVSTSRSMATPAHPQPEAYWAMSIRSASAPATMRRRCAETLFMDYHRQNGVDIRIVRIFNTYGPRMPG